MDAIVREFLGKDCASVVIGYLTDLPLLPFLRELQAINAAGRLVSPQFLRYWYDPEWTYRTFWLHRYDERGNFIGPCKCHFC